MVGTQEYDNDDDDDDGNEVDDGVRLWKLGETVNAKQKVLTLK